MNRTQSISGGTMLEPIAIATAICGTLDILFAMILTVAFGRQIRDMLRSVASGPFPAATTWAAAARSSASSSISR